MFDSNNDGNIDIAEELNIRYQYLVFHLLIENNNNNNDNNNNNNNNNNKTSHIWITDVILAIIDNVLSTNFVYPRKDQAW